MKVFASNSSARGFRLPPDTPHRSVQLGLAQGHFQEHSDQT
jgi:hypothetical protein